MLVLFRRLIKFHISAFLLVFCCTAVLSQNSRVTLLTKAIENSLESVFVIGVNAESSPRSNSGSKVDYLGNGIVVEKSGLILTNAHVISGHEKTLRVFDYHGNSYLAEVIFKDQSEDLALLKILVSGHKKQFKPLKFALPKDLILGEDIWTIGCPCGLPFSVSKGILSNWNRRVDSGEKSYIQTDIEVNPGNSGGPLMNMAGEMTGLMIARQDNAQGIGFAIPVGRIERVLNRWFSPEFYSYSSLGFKVRTKLNKKTKKAKVVIDSMSSELRSNKKLVKGAEVVSIDGVKLRTSLDFYRYVMTAVPGQEFKIELRGNKTFKTRLKPLAGLALVEARLGIKLVELSPAIAHETGMPFDEGVAVVEPFNCSGGVIKRGFIFFKIENSSIANTNDLTSIVKNLKKGDKVRVYFMDYPQRGESGVNKMIEGELLVR